ncbi:MAG TPA: hypothetical protein VNA89_02820, partial [Gemmatimonadaceae bacterium]|nr:hypothetical protein [Gemmatimonadaceae bacterium]
MSTSPGLLEFFLLEAGEYVERLDALLAAGGQSGPGAEDFLRFARALRGSATMNRQGPLAEVAAGIERVARALRDGTLVWEPTIAGVVTAAVDDFKVLLHGVRNWGPAEEQRAHSRMAELARWAPQTTRPYTPTPSFSSSAAFLVAESVAIADALDVYAARPADRVALGLALARVRALRGLAALRDLPPLPDVVEAVERAAKPIELGEGAPERPQLEVFASAARLLRRAASELRLGGNPDATSPEAQAFAAAAGALADTTAAADRIIPISELFFGDGQPDIIARAPNPPTTPAQRFRLEAVSQAEHLRRLVADARQAVSGVGRERVARELRAALRSLRSAADSFGEREVAAFVAAQEDAVAAFDPAALRAVDEIAAYLASPTADRGELTRRIGELGARGRGRTPALGAPAMRRTPVV